MKPLLFVFLCVTKMYQGLELGRFYSPFPIWCRQITRRLEKKNRRERFTSAGIKVTVNVVLSDGFSQKENIVYDLTKFNNPFTETSRARLLFLVRRSLFSKRSCGRCYHQPQTSVLSATDIYRLFDWLVFFTLQQECVNVLFKLISRLLQGVISCENARGEVYFMASAKHTTRAVWVY